METYLKTPISRPAKAKGCGCAKCREAARTHPSGCKCTTCRDHATHMRGRVEGEVPSGTPKIPSCDPKRHKFRKMNVVRWVNRTRPCKRKIPPSLDLGILARARTRIPLSEVKWFINEAKITRLDKTYWVRRLPGSHINSLVDLTVELFIQQKPGMSLRQIQTAFGGYLKNRHSTELGPVCDRGMFLHFVGPGSTTGKAFVERNFGLRRFGLSLDRLYQRAGVDPSKREKCGGGRDEMSQRFILVAYITLPNAFEAKLRPPLPDPPPPPSLREQKARAKRLFPRKIKEVLRDIKSYPPGYDRARSICLLNKIGREGINKRYISQFQAHGYAGLSAHDAPVPWKNTEDARKDFLDAIRVTKTRSGLLARVLAMDEDIFAGLQRVYLEYQMTGSAPRRATARRQRDWVAKQQKNPKSIYSCYNQ